MSIIKIMGFEKNLVEHSPYTEQEEKVHKPSLEAIIGLATDTEYVFDLDLSGESVRSLDVICKDPSIIALFHHENERSSSIKNFEGNTKLVLKTNAISKVVDIRIKAQFKNSGMIRKKDYDLSVATVIDKSSVDSFRCKKLKAYDNPNELLKFRFDTDVRTDEVEDSEYSFNGLGKVVKSITVEGDENYIKPNSIDCRYYIDSARFDHIDSKDNNLQVHYICKVVEKLQYKNKKTNAESLWTNVGADPVGTLHIVLPNDTDLDYYGLIKNVSDLDCTVVKVCNGYAETGFTTFWKRIKNVKHYRINIFRIAELSTAKSDKVEYVIHNNELHFTMKDKGCLYSNISFVETQNIEPNTCFYTQTNLPAGKYIVQVTAEDKEGGNVGKTVASYVQLTQSTASEFFS